MWKRLPLVVDAITVHRSDRRCAGLHRAVQKPALLDDQLSLGASTNTQAYVVGSTIRGDFDSISGDMIQG